MTTLAAAVDRAAAAAGADGSLFEAQIRPADPRFGDYQANGILPYAKRLRQNPRELAQQIVGQLAKSGELDADMVSWEIAGPGFINFRLSPKYLRAWLLAFADRQQLRQGAGKRLAGQTVVVDYSSPNTAKEMHVGHIRTTVIGETLARLLEFSGAKVIRDNHIGDWGTQFGMIIWAIKQSGFQIASAPEDTVVAELEVLYKQGNEAYKSSPELAETIRAELVKLQQGDPENTAIWEDISRVSWQSFEKIYTQLGIHFDEVLGESFYRDKVESVCAELETLGIAQVDAGALVVFHPEHKRFAKQPFIIRKADGASNYATTDLATILYRAQHFEAQHIIYVVDSRQSDHFEQLFLTAQKWFAATGRALPRLEHVSFGSVLGENGKPIKTKEGGSIKLRELLAEAIDRADATVRAKNNALTKEEYARIAKVVGLGGIRYADLSQNRSSDYVFSWARMLSFDGNTAPYLLYAAARIHSIFRKVDETDCAVDYSTASTMETEEEIALARKLLNFPGVLDMVLGDLRPHVLCTYLFELAGMFSSFYNANKVITEDAAVQARRLLLCHRTLLILETGLGLLGLETLERM